MKQLVSIYCALSQSTQLLNQFISTNITKAMKEKYICIVIHVKDLRQVSVTTTTIIIMSDNNLNTHVKVSISK